MKFIVDGTTVANGTHSTISAALTSASSGDTIFIRPGTYTENLTLKVGVNLCANTCDALTPNVTISGTCTLTSAGSVSISGICLQTNGAALLAVTGSAASILNLNNCYLNCTNNTGITFSTANTSAAINITNCNGDIGTTGITLFTDSSTGTLNIYNTLITNSGTSTTASTQSAGSSEIKYCQFYFPITTSGTAFSEWNYLDLDTTDLNTTSAILGGSVVANVCRFCRFSAGTASAVSCGSAVVRLDFCIIVSSNTNAITGSGTLTGNTLLFNGTSSLVNTTTQTPEIFGIEASWTPDIQINSSSTGITYTTQIGGSCILGKVVFIWGQILLSSKGASVGGVTISNLPYAPTANGGGKSLAISEYNQVTKAGYTSLGLRLANSTVGTFILSSATGSAISIMSNAEISDTFSFKFSTCYIID